MNEMRHGEGGEQHVAEHGAPGGLAISTVGYTMDVGSKTLAANREETSGPGESCATSTNSTGSACT